MAAGVKMADAASPVSQALHAGGHVQQLHVMLLPQASVGESCGPRPELGSNQPPQEHASVYLCPCLTLLKVPLTGIMP